MPSPAGLDQILQSVSDAMFPADLRARKITIDSVGICGDTPLHTLLWRADTAGALAIIEHGADVNAPGEMGQTPLHVTVRLGNHEAIRALRDAGARDDVISEFEVTARDLARKRGIPFDAC